MNKFIGSGRLGNDCEVGTTSSGTTVCSFSIAVDSGYGDNKKTMWIKCALFGKRASGGLPQYLVKGQEVLISGELSVDTWSKDGKDSFALKVMIQDVDLIGGKQEARQSPQQSQPQAPQADSYQQSNDFDDSSIPF